MEDAKVIVSPADAEIKGMYEITNDSKIRIDGKVRDKILRVKGTHEYSVAELIQDPRYKDAFAGGKFVHSYLSVYDMHRFCSPVKGEVKCSKAIQGKVSLEVCIDDDGNFDAPDNADNGYEFTQTRGILILDTGEEIVAVIPVGMSQVSSVNMNVPVGVKLYKGQEFGYFLFGGSDIIMLFQKESNFEIDKIPMKKKAGQRFGTISN